MPTFGRNELAAYMRGHKLVVISTVNSKSEPEAALMGVGITDALELVFDTTSRSRKHGNLLARPRAAATFFGPGEQTLQYEGVAIPVSATEPADRDYRERYYTAWPDGRSRLHWDGLVYWRLKPLWARYSRFDPPTIIEEFHWN
jgi:pyridoxamine 5'-phosphate oxidase-like protein